MTKRSALNNTHFPFTALVGQTQAQLALLLAAIDPLLGGVLIEGGRGTAKSTMARGLAPLLDHAPFVNLPLGASEEQLVGTLDLEAVLNDKKVHFRPGLLAKAHSGILYVDEVNLLPDHLVDLLLDTAASGINCIERDGISHTHDARFVLIGTSVEIDILLKHGRSESFDKVLGAQVLRVLVVGQRGDRVEDESMLLM